MVAITFLSFFLLWMSCTRVCGTTPAGALPAALETEDICSGLGHSCAFSALQISHSSVSSPAIPSSRCIASDFNGRDFDLVIYGATGFTGELAAEYLAKSYPDRPRWAFAGRDAEALDELRAKLSSNSSLLSVIIADLNNATALADLTRRTRVVLTFAGPYEKIGGEALIRSSLTTCTHYVDITGETPWKVLMLERYGSVARARGLALVQSAGFDSLPADVLALSAAELVAIDGKGPPNSVANVYFKTNGYISGGTIASGEYIRKHHKGSKAFTDPYCLAPEVPTSNRVDTTMAGRKYGYDPYFQTITKRSGMSVCDCTTVRRTLSQRFQDTPISFSESVSIEAGAHLIEYMADPLALLDPPPMPPKPGEGPPKWMQQKGSWTLKSIAVRSNDGKFAECTMEGAYDPGYLGTAMMATEFALGLALDGPEVGSAGYLTPVLALGASRLAGRLRHAEGGRFVSITCKT